MKKKIRITLITGAMLLFLCCFAVGCEEEKEKEKVSLSIWATEAKMDMMDGFMKDFIALHKDEADIEYKISREDEDTCRETILANPDGAPDVFAFADDQLDDLKNAGVLHEFDKNADEALKPFGGKGSVAYESVVRDGKVYAYPETGNGYFLYYNKSYYGEGDVKSLERMVQVAADINKKVCMYLGSGWYLYSFFKGAGLELKLDDTGKKNICNWNATDTPHTGLSVAESLSAICAKRSFVSLADDGLIEGIKDGSIIACVSGAWNADAIKQAWGDDYAATKLPTFTVDDQNVQMASFMGYKVLGIGAKTKHPKWSEQFVEFVTSKENQVKEFETVGEVPANHEVEELNAVKKAPAVMALSAQSEFATLQRVAAPFWDAAAQFGNALASGNPDKVDLQVLLDDMVRGITE